MDSRYTRQVRLTEVGERGQARIASAAFSAASDDEALYLARAGAAAIGRSAGGAFAHAGAFRFGASRDLAASAWRALAQLRAEVQR